MFYFIIHSYFLRRFSQSEPRSRNLTRFCFFSSFHFRFFHLSARDRSHSCIRLYLFRDSFLQARSLAVARWTRHTITTDLSLFHCTAPAVVWVRECASTHALTRPTKHYSITGQFSDCSCGILWSDRSFWCNAMRNFQCGKVTDDGVESKQHCAAWL